MLEEAIDSGDLRRAASFLVVEYGPDVMATCAAMVKDRVAAEDVAQDVFSDAIRALATFRRESSPRTWLLSIARNRCIDYLRARSRDAWRGMLDEADVDQYPDEAAHGAEWFADRSLLARALDTLAEGDRALVVLRFKNGLEYGELAEAFGLREGTVRMRISRALARMRAAISPPQAAPGAPAARFGAIAAPRAASALEAPSWWDRFKQWLHGGAPARRQPIGALGAALASAEPSPMSEALVARLGTMVASLDAGR